MTIDSKHPLWSEYAPEWVQLKDTYRGQAAIKEKRTTYLPATSGMEADGMGNNMPGKKAYDAYLKRAAFPEVMRDAVNGMVGIMHRKPARIEIPKKLESLLESATESGESLQLLLRKINEQQLLYGRTGLLLEVPQNVPISEAIPFIILYRALKIINWDAQVIEKGKRKLSFVVLDESRFELSSAYEWEHQEIFRLLTLRGDGSGAGAGTYQSAEIYKSRELESTLLSPSIGGRTLDKIPFVFVNANDLVPEPENPPLSGLSNLALTIYRGEADFRQALFQQGQETLVIMGREEQYENKETRIGAGAVLDLPINGDAKYVGVSADGLEQMAKALENDKTAAQNKGAQLIQNAAQGTGRESGEALRIRVSASTSTLSSIARAGAAGLTDILKLAAEWVGANPEEVIVEPNMDFTDDLFTGKELLDFTSAKNMGAPISNQTIHRVMKIRDLTEMDFEEELEAIKNEEPLVEPVNPDSPFEEDEEENE